MKIEVEFRSDMSRAETFRALRITLEAATRLSHRMTPEDLQRVENFGAALIAAAENERRRRSKVNEAPKGLADSTSLRCLAYIPSRDGLAGEFCQPGAEKANRIKRGLSYPFVRESERNPADQHLNDSGSNSAIQDDSEFAGGDGRRERVAPPVVSTQ